ncbi:hypothetical protein [Lysinibacillus capsici]|uniref:hypothetical protein n=1 Tax=Lysinibacillus capsici TaxID=2115968 RepID=UPI0034E5987D
MNQEQLNAVKERVAKATPGPWEIDRNSDDCDFITDIWFNQDGDHVEVHDKSVMQSVLNAEFIAHSREDVPALVAEVERLREALSIYADEKRWVEPCISTALVNGEPETVKDAPWAILDCGDYARQALGGETK